MAVLVVEVVIGPPWIVVTGVPREVICPVELVYCFGMYVEVALLFMLVTTGL